MIAEPLALLETILDRMATPTGLVYVGRNYATDELLGDLWELRRLLRNVEAEHE
jgi:hypothetical protein